MSDQMKMVKVDLQQFLVDHLKLWKDEGIPAPLNELQSIQSWLYTFGAHGQEETLNRMRQRMLILQAAAEAVHAQGEAFEDEVGIYEKRSHEDAIKAKTR
jgi:hypothetical protein